MALTRDGYLYSWGIGNSSERAIDSYTKKVRSYTDCYKPVLLEVKIEG